MLLGEGSRAREAIHARERLERLAMVPGRGGTARLLEQRELLRERGVARVRRRGGRRERGCRRGGVSR